MRVWEMLHVDTLISEGQDLLNLQYCDASYFNDGTDITSMEDITRHSVCEAWNIYCFYR